MYIVQHHPTSPVVKGTHIEEDELLQDPEIIKELIKSFTLKGEKDLPENYRTCINFFQLLRNMAEFGMK